MHSVFDPNFCDAYTVSACHRLKIKVVFEKKNYVIEFIHLFIVVTVVCHRSCILVVCRRHTNWSIVNPLLRHLQNIFKVSRIPSVRRFRGLFPDLFSSGNHDLAYQTQGHRICIRGISIVALFYL